MHDEHPHPLLAQVPLTVSPFLSLPTATPLPYTYKQLPSTLPPSVLSSNATSDHSQPQSQSQPQQPPAYVMSSSGTTATPDQILSSCIALQSHLQSLENEARNTLRAWEDKRKAEDLAEKRRVAPGWLDGDVKLLRPDNVGGGDAEMGEAGAQDQGQAQSGTHQRRASLGSKALVERRDGMPDPSEGEELDRAFGGMDLK